MHARALFGELVYTARSAACLLAVLAFTLLFALAVTLLPAVAGLGSVFALLLLAITVPAFARFLVTVTESRSTGRPVEPPGVELFAPAGAGGMLFPLLCTLALVLVALPFISSKVPLWGVGLAIVGSVAIPAMIGVYAVTRSPLQALNPVTVAGLVKIIGASFVAAPVFIVLSIGIVRALLAAGWWLGLLAAVYLLTALHALVGGLLRAADLPQAIELPEDESIRTGLEQGALERERRACLNHAYGLFSRDNRAGALDYLRKWLDTEPDTAAAYAWFQAQMLAWDDQWPALWFGQEHLGWLLAAGESVRAVKLILRLQLVDERFRPTADDLPAAVAALRDSGNAELADRLERALS